MLINQTPYKTIFNEDVNGREITIYKFKNAYPNGDVFYPNCAFEIEGELVNFSTEKVMSLEKIDNDAPVITTDVMYYNVNEPVFYFVYNTDNYYHFIYDTLPYLISYFELKKEIPELKLLMNYPNFSKKEFYLFVTEFLDLLGINEKDILIIKSNHIYKEIYVSNSYTHGFKSNLPPSTEIYDFYTKLVNLAKEKSNIDIDSLPKKFYISRRSWMHGDTSNIGTNYTSRRKMESEDLLVSILEKEGIKEIFTEKLSTIEKIVMFNNAELVVGAIGGGLCNVLFSNPNTNLLCIVSPTFLNINFRFKYCFDRVKCFYFDETYHTEKTFWKKWMRVNIPSMNIIGEIEDVNGDELSVLYTSNKVAGWNSELELKRIKVRNELCEALDEGLNSSWDLDLDYFYKKFFN
jgi:capsular polysaccharide biosynthesis protein